jgi:hypothetical protein
MLPKGLTGPVNFNPQMLPREWPEQSFTGLNLLRDTLSRKVEAGCRPVIAWYLAQAVGCARRIFGDPRLAVHSEVRVPSVLIPDVGLVGGTQYTRLSHRRCARSGAYAYFSCLSSYLLC